MKFFIIKEFDVGKGSTMKIAYNPVALIFFFYQKLLQLGP